MEKKRDLAIVLRSLPYEDRHRIVTALTQSHGQLSVIAHNSIQSRRFGGTLEPFAAGEWYFTEKPGAELQRLDEAKILRPFEGLRKNFETLSLASALNELMLRLAPKLENCEELFRLHSNALAVLDAPLPELRPQIALLNAYLAKLLQWSGNQPRILECLGCTIRVEQLDPRQSLSCVIPDAGWVCASCRASGTRHVQSTGMGDFDRSLLKISPNAVLDFHQGLALPIRQCAAQTRATEQEQKELFRFLEALFIFHVPGFDRIPLKSLRFLGLESNLRPATGLPL